MTQTSSHDSTQALTFAALAMLAFAALAYGVLRWGHPHEDAYILFIYSELLAETGRIAYFDGGPPTEGATDFLWMVAIAGLVWVGLSPAVAALILNALGVSLAAGLIAHLVLRAGGGAVLAGLGAALTVFTVGVQAGYGGFSTPLYAALCLLLFVLLWRARETGLLWVPVLSLLVALFRPDGVIIGVAATLVAFSLCPKERRGRFLRVMVLMGAMGVAYFLWRMGYFEELLPLPLIVKGEADLLLPGLSEILRWVGRVAILLALAVIVLRHTDGGRRVWLALLPFALHLTFLAFAVQSQNIAFRFEGPQTVVALCLGMLGVVALSRHPRAVFRAGSVAAILVFAASEARFAATELRYLTNRDYINFLPQYLAPELEAETTIALTEAGRMAYWVPGRKVDLVGLNTAYTARNGADAAYIDSVDPDLIFFHIDGTARLGCGGASLCEITVPELLAQRFDGRAPEEVLDRVRRAPLAIYAYLGERPQEYRLFTALYGSGHYHVHAVARAGRVDPDAFRAALERSFDPGPHPGYLESYRQLRRQNE